MEETSDGGYIVVGVAFDILRGCFIWLIKTDDRGVIEWDRIFPRLKGLPLMFYGKDVQRSVLISTIESYKLAQDNGINPALGSLGENILIDYNPYHLSVGSRIKIGNSILEITQHCTLCKSLTKVNSKLPKILKDDRGIFAKVIEDGIIREGDKLYIL